MKAVITCGPSSAPIDRVRRITNFATGEIGTLLSEALLRAGFDVLCLRGEGATFRAPERVDCISFCTNADLFGLLRQYGGGADVLFHAAALVDYEVVGGGHPGKFDSSLPRVTLELTAAPKLLPQLPGIFPEALVVGWKYEVVGGRDRAVERAVDQIRKCGTSYSVVNGAAYGDGYGLTAISGLVEHHGNKPALVAALTRLAVAHRRTEQS